ncbi:MAG: toxic anion resistance protein [Ruminococcus sp.]
MSCKYYHFIRIKFNITFHYVHRGFILRWALFLCPLWRGNINRGKKKALAKESERGIVELETLKRVNDNLIQTIEETIKIQ